MREIHVYAGGVSSSINIGRQGEHLASRVVFHLDVWREELGQGYAQLLFIRHGDAAPYPCALVQQGDTAAWPVISLDTEKAGGGWCELRYLNGTAMLKSRRFAVTVDPCISGNTPDTPTGVAENWLEQLLEKESTGARAAGLAAGAEAAEKAIQDAEVVLEGYQRDCEAAADRAEVAQALSETAQGLSEVAQGLAETAQTGAESAQAAAEAAAASAASDVSALLAGYVAGAEAAQAGAETAQGLAEAAQGLAETAQGLAETAQARAETAQWLAETAQVGAETAQGLSEAAQAGAETAKTGAETAKTGAETAQAAAELAAAQALAAATAVAVTFTEAEWTYDEETDYYTLRIAQSAHGKTDGDFLYKLYHQVDGTYVSNTWALAGTNVFYDSVTCNIELTVRTAYAGKIVLI